MPLAARESSVSESRIQALKARHTKIEQELDRELHHPSISDEQIKLLKKMKLSIKEEIEGIKEAS